MKMEKTKKTSEAEGLASGEILLHLSVEDKARIKRLGSCIRIVIFFNYYRGLKIQAAQR